MRNHAIVFAVVVLLLLCSGHSSVRAGWALNGAPVCIYSGEQEYPVICTDGAGGAIMAWEDRRDYPDIWAQRVDEMGRRLWAVAGVAICTESYNQIEARICPDGAGGAIIAWSDMREFMNYNIYAQRVGPDGNVLWAVNGVPVCTYAMHQRLNYICADGFGGAIIVWQDERNSPEWDDIYCQRVDADGNMLWTANGVPLRVGGYLDEWARVVPDGSGGAIFSWLVAPSPSISAAVITRAEIGSRDLRCC